MSRRLPVPAIAGSLLACVFLCSVRPALAAEDVYHTIPLRELRITDGAKLDSEIIDSIAQEGMWPRIVVTSGEAYIHTPRPRDPENETPITGRQHRPMPLLAVRAAAGSKVRGVMAWEVVQPFAHVLEAATPAAEKYTGRLVHFEIELPTKSGADSKPAFFAAKLAHFERLGSNNILSGANSIPGGAWFRYQAHVARTALGKDKKSPETNRVSELDWRTRNELDESFGLLTGGRAIAENLQLDRMLPVVKEDKPTVALASLDGITVREFDWKPLVKDLKPGLDPLSARIPFDQHAIFFPNFAAMIAVADTADDRGTPLLRSIMPQSVNSNVRQRYERQLCLPAGAISRLLGPHLVRSVALTGGDPYLMTGADVAILFEATNVAALKTLIDSRVALAGATDKQARAVQGKVGDAAYSGMVSPDRAICSYVATLGDTVVVTNSLAQLKRLVSVDTKQTRSLAALDEYAFFRDRYRRGQEDEQALAIISDATIRRWCSPQWRIAAGRTVRAAAVMADAQAENMHKLVAGQIDPSSVVPYRPLLDAGHLTLGRSGVQSDHYGTLAFQTPIIEQQFTHVTPLEADIYERWRSGYQSNWSNYFDPIAVRIHMSQEKMAADVTVMPLIDRSDYDNWYEVSIGGTLGAASGDPHPTALAHWVMALNPDSQSLKSYTNIMSLGVLRLNTLGWIGSSMAVYAEEDPFWEELAKAPKQEDFLEKNLRRLPIVVQVDVRDPLKLAAFLTGLRAMVESSAPDVTVWETRKHRDQSYVRIEKSRKPQAKDGFGGYVPDLTLCYAPCDDVLIITLNEELLKKALDRRADRAAAGKEPPAADMAGPKWLGKNIAVHLDRRVLLLYEMLSAGEHERQMQRLAWANLPILNEWHRLFPDADPVAIDERIWQRQLVCPGGGSYRWNEKWQTMESTAYGHPGEPKSGPPLSQALKSIAAADFGLTFGHNGIRAQAVLTNTVETPAASEKK